VGADGRVLCERVEVADTILPRARGLLGRGHLSRGTGMTFRPGWSIHTAFMRFAIDVVFLDPELVVRRIDSTLRPFRTASFKGAREVVELAAGECALRGLQVGEQIAWKTAGKTVPGDN
jgi:uncharacterized protein